MARLLASVRNARANAPEPQPFQALGTVQAPLIAVVGASGGVGLSTIALVMASLAARDGLETTLIEADLQFGDYGYWLGLDDGPTGSAAGWDARPQEVAEHLRLCKAPTLPELADEVADELADGLARLRRGTALAIADAGCYWTGLTARLVLESDLFLMVVDQRPSSVYAAARAVALCGRIGVPLARMAVVYNRWTPKAALSASEVAHALGAGQAYCIPDGKVAVERLVGSNAVGELIAAGGPFVKGARELLGMALPRVGCAGGDGARQRGGLLR